MSVDEWMTDTGSLNPTMSKPLTPIELPWFHIGRPWADKPGLIYAGSEDPHVGTFVVSVDDWPDELFFGLEPDKDVAAIAERIVADHNAALAARSSSAPAELDAAWKEAEEALPEGWWIRDVARDGNATLYRWQADAVGPKHWEEEYGEGSTPAAALIALAATLARRLTSSPENPR